MRFADDRNRNFTVIWRAAFDPVAANWTTWMPIVNLSNAAPNPPRHGGTRSPQSCRHAHSQHRSLALTGGIVCSRTTPSCNPVTRHGGTTPSKKEPFDGQ